MRLIDLLLPRPNPPDDERSMKAARIDELERDAHVAVADARRELDRRVRLAAAVDDASRSWRQAHR